MRLAEVVGDYASKTSARVDKRSAELADIARADDRAAEATMTLYLTSGWRFSHEESATSLATRAAHEGDGRHTSDTALAAGTGDRVMGRHRPACPPADS